MSRTALAISLLVAAGLSLVLTAILMQPTAPEHGGTTRLLDFDPAAVTGIVVREAKSDSSLRLERTGRGWLLLSEPDHAGAQPWPLIPSRVNGLLSVLDQLDGKRTKSSSGESLTNPITIELIGESETLAKIQIDGVSIGGRQFVKVDDGRVAVVETDLSGALTNPGPRGWRSPSPLPGIGPDVSRVAIQSEQGDIQLRRVGKQWFLAAPIHARADQQTVAALFAALSDLTIRRFLDDGVEAPDSSLAGFNEPLLAVNIEKDRRRIDESGEAHTITDSDNLIIGIPADVTGATRYAMANNASPMLVIEAKSLGQLPALARDYVSPFSSGAQPSDVGMLVIRETGQSDRGFRRAVSGWSRQGADGASELDDWSDIEELIAFLTSAETADILLSPPDGLSLLGEITLLDFAGGELQSLAYGRDALGDLVILETIAGADEPAYRVYKSAPSLLFVGEDALGG